MGWGALPFHFPVLAEVFQHHGYTTALVADNPHIMKEGFGFGRGFRFVKDVPGQTEDAFQPDTAPMIDLPCDAAKLEPRPGRIERYRRNAWWYRQQGTTTTETVCREAMRWLDDAPEKFFLWIDCFDPHEPWDAQTLARTVSLGRFRRRSDLAARWPGRRLPPGRPGQHAQPLPGGGQPNRPFSRRIGSPSA